MPTKRYLTKSRFALATECPTKLFYTGKREYANQKLEDSFLQALADGGFQVGELAKYYFAGGHDIKALGYDEALARTNELLQQDQVTIYEAAIATDTLFIRADILVKDGDRLRLYEVKAKSINAGESFITKSGGIYSGWQKYLYDVAFQKYVINRALPGYTVLAHLLLADKSATCPTDGLNQKFRLVKDDDGRRSVVVSATITNEDLTPPILRAVNVDHECDLIYAGTEGAGSDGADAQALSFSQRVALYADRYASNTKISTPVSKACGDCEFYAIEHEEQAGLLNGKKECWKAMLGWQDQDFAEPTVLDVWSYLKKDQMIASGCIKMMDLAKVDINPGPDNKPGISASERRWLQVEKYQTGDSSVWIDQPGLEHEMSSWVFPLHFIDFETSMVAIPFNAGLRPYEGIAFQFSHHVLYEDGTVAHVGEYLNTERGVFPNYEFVRALKKQLENDNGSIFRYSNHENTYLNMIYRQLRANEQAIADCDELCAFIQSITHSGESSDEQWRGERDMIDLLDLVKRYYYDPATNGSNSIKAVLPALLNSSRFLQDKYSQPIYGAVDGIASLNFKDWQWIELKDGVVTDPYKRLPKMFADVSNKDMQLLSTSDELSDGGAALTAYGRMQFEEMSDYEREEIRQALLKYCELDTLAMVMIYEGWRELLG